MLWVRFSGKWGLRQTNRDCSFWGASAVCVRVDSLILASRVMILLPHNNLNNNNDNKKSKRCTPETADQVRFPHHAKQPRKGNINGQSKATLSCQWCLPPMGQQHELLATAICMHTLHVHTSKTLCVTGTEVPSSDIT